MRRVSSVMTAVPVTLQEGETLAAAARAMRDNAIGAVMVLRDGRLRGMLTDRDIVIRAVARGRDPEKMPISEMCTPDPAAVRPGDDVATAVRLMRDRRVRRVPVVEDGHPVGLVSIGDLAIEQDGQDHHSALVDICTAPPNA